MSEPVESEVLFVRHTLVDEKYQPLCYGVSDVELGAKGVVHAREVASTLALFPVDRIIHSGLKRASFLAEQLAEFTGQTVERHDGLRERDFGSWELRSWNDIFDEHGNDILKMITEPETFRPGGGETTREFVERVVNACDDLHRPGRTVVVSHGGVIAVLTGLARRVMIRSWRDLIPEHGEIRRLDRVSDEHFRSAFPFDEET